MSHYIERWCQKHGDWSDDVDSPSEGCPECIKDGSFKTRSQLQEELSQERAAREKAEGALKHILWIKDCGVDARDENGVFRNHPDVERDAMYDIAQKALKERP